VELGGGYDSNANAGVAQSSLTLPTLGPVTVAPLGVAQASGFGWIAAGVQGTYPVAPGFAVFGSIAGNGTFYGSASEFDLANGSIAAGASYLAGRNWYALTLAHADIALDGSQYRSSNGVGFEWRHQISERATVSLAPQYAQLSYTGANDARDADYTAIAASYRRQWATAWQPVMNLTGYYGDEHNTRGFAYLGRQIYGAGADVTLSPSPPWALTAALAWMRSDYDAPYPIIDVTRRDDNWSLSLGAAYFFSRNWSARVEYQYARNNSNLALYEYSRNTGALKLRYEFK
jgi:predicted porin